MDSRDGLPRGALPSGILKIRKKCPGLKVPCSAWIAILYVYIIWSSVKYDANYMNFKDLSSKSELNQKRRGDSVSDEPTKSFSKSQGHPHKEKMIAELIMVELSNIKKLGNRNNALVQ